MVAGLVHPHDGIRVCAGRIRTGAHDDAGVREGPQGIQIICPFLAQQRFQIAVRLLVPADKCTLHGHQDLVFLTDLYTLRRRQAAVDDGMAVVSSREVIEGFLEGPCGLVKGRIADGVHLDLEPCPVSLLAEICHFFVRVIEDAFIIAQFIRRLKGRICRSEAAVQGRLKAAADPRKLTSSYLVHVHGLEEDPHLKAVVKTFCKPALQVHIHVCRKTDAADRVDHADALGCHVVGGIFHVFNQLGQGNGACHRIGHSKEGLLVHLTGILVEASEVFDLLSEFLQEGRIDHTGVSVIFADKDRLVRTDAVQLLAADQLPFKD